MTQNENPQGAEIERLTKEISRLKEQLDLSALNNPLTSLH